MLFLLLILLLQFCPFIRLRCKTGLHSLQRSLSTASILPVVYDLLNGRNPTAQQKFVD
uniref:Uncharacterized protein n=1 Tax=Anguilla anguilla TaxID=7936 RepID=A0A0E9WZK5_ANGAN